MKLQIVLAAGAPTPPEMSKFFKLMAFNPNEGQLAAWLFKLPELKLPSTRPAHAMFMRSYARITPPVVEPATVFPVPADLKLVRDYYAAKKILVPQLAKVLPFLYWMCEKIVDTSPIFRAHFGEVKMRDALLFFILTGQMAHRAPPAAKAIFTRLQEDTLNFAPTSLDDVSIKDLQENNYNELQVAKTLGKLTRDWFAAQIDIEARLKKEVRKNLELLKEYGLAKKEVWPGNRAYERKDHVIRIDGVDTTYAKARAACLSNKHTITITYTEALDRKSVERKRIISPIKESILRAPDSPTTWLHTGLVSKFQKEYPDLATLCILVTPTFTSAVNQYMAPSMREYYKDKPAGKEIAMLDSLHKQAWMSRYASQKVVHLSKLPAADTAHAWMRLTALKKAELEEVFTTEKIVLDLNDVDNLTVDQFKRIISVVGAEKSIATVFKAVLKESIFKRKFLTALIQQHSVLESPFGAIEKKMLVKNMAAGGNDGVLLSAQSVQKWNPSKDSIAEILSKMTRKVADLPEVKDKAQLAATEAHLNTFVWGGHKTSFKLEREWDVPVSAVQAAHLKAASGDPDSWIIKDAFHGTSISAAGAILMSGFRMSQSFVKTAQSMGPVLYMAPNIDKALQYIGDSFGRGKEYGIIFHGDMVVHGKTPPDHTRQLAGNTDWTKTTVFATEEIGLVHPNAQFIVRKAYLVEREHEVQKPVKGRNLFQKPVPASSYNPAGTIVASKSAAITHDFKADQRVVVREGPDAWFVGTISSIGKTQIKVAFDDDAIATIKRSDFGEVRKIILTRTRPEKLTDKQAKALKSAKEVS